MIDSDFWPNGEFIDRFVCLSAALCQTKMLEYPGVGGVWRLLYARNERKATNLSEMAQIRVEKRCINIPKRTRWTKDGREWRSAGC
jgi:hypothetical protein